MPQGKARQPRTVHPTSHGCGQPADAGKAGLRAHLRRGSITQGEGSCDPGMAYDELLAGRVRDCLREVAGVGMNHG